MRTGLLHFSTPIIIPGLPKCTPKQVHPIQIVKYDWMKADSSATPPAPF